MDEKQHTLQRLRTRAETALSQIINAERVEPGSIDYLLHEVEVYRSS